MARVRAPQPPIHLVSAHMLDVEKGELVAPGDLLIEGERIVDVAPASVPRDAVVIDLGELTLLPGLMDMEVNLLLGGPDHASPLNAVQDDPAVHTLRAVANARRTLRAGFTTVRNLGLFVQTGGLLLDVALKKTIDLGWIDGPRVVPAGHAITPTGGHLDPTMFQALAPHIMPLTVEEGIANGVSEVRKAVRYQIKHGAQLIKVCASGGVMSQTGPAGAQQYSDEELRAIVDEAHRAWLRVAAISRAIELGVRIACGTDAPAIPHGRNAKELLALVDRGHDATAGDPPGDDGLGATDRRRRTAAGSRPGSWPTSSPFLATRWRISA
jgi:imidazolonepropionase-like amidohydrolase